MAPGSQAKDGYEHQVGCGPVQVWAEQGRTQGDCADPRDDPDQNARTKFGNIRGELDPHIVGEDLELMGVSSDAIGVDVQRRRLRWILR
ncbi:MAG: hypothetical protein CML07_00160 [Psychrobacter sp.]|nr:hypothetical protein [Psychrobacter sp.]